MRPSKKKDYRENKRWRPDLEDSLDRDKVSAEYRKSLKDVVCRGGLRFSCISIRGLVYSYEGYRHSAMRPSEMRFARGSSEVLVRLVASAYEV